MIRLGIPRAFRLALRRRDSWERDVEDEIKLHLSLRAEQLSAQGAAPDEAYSEAVRRFGPLDESRARLVDAAAHREQRMRRTEFLGDLRQDIAFAFRTLGRQKGWTAITVGTLALGIGATTAVFSVVSALLLHPLPYPHANRIVFVAQAPSEGNNTGMHVTITPSAAVVRAWMALSHDLESIEGFTSGPYALKTAGDPSYVMGARVFPSFMAFAGQRPIAGRMFTDADVAGGTKVVVLGESFWRDRFGARTDVVGKAITLGDSLFTVIGVAPQGLERPGRGGLSTAVWLPLDVHNDKLSMAVIARVRSGASITAAERELDSIFAREAGFSSGKIPFHAVVSTPAQLVSFHDSLILLTAAVALVLLVACANVAHLLLARAGSRRRELAIRAALGAGRARLTRQLLTESLVLAVSGTAVGVMLGWIGLHALVALRPPSLDELKLASLDGRTLLVATGVALVSGVGFGLTGLAQSARHSTHVALKTGALAASHGQGASRVRGLLVVTEMALAAMLLVGANLLVRSVMNLQRADLGFAPRGLYMITLPVPRTVAPTSAAAAGVVAVTMARIRQLPAVTSATLADVGPGSRAFSIGRLEVEGKAPPPRSTSSFVDVNQIQPNYFATMRARLTQGATFSDTTAASRQVIVNAGFARAQWADGSALGHRIRVAQTDSEPWLTIVGVVADMATGGPTSESTAPALFTPLAIGAGESGTPRSPTILVRTSGTAQGLAPISGFIRQNGVKRPPEIASVAQQIDSSVAAPRFVMLLLTIFTALALLLAAVGLYGVMAYSVIQRTREIGIRMALGAQRGTIARLVVVRGVTLALIGAALGLGGAYWATRLLSKLLYGVTPLDGTSFAVGGAVLIGVAVLACVVPTRRALAVDPILAIRAD